MAADRLIVDGMNVIGSRPDGWWKDRPAAQVRLARRLATYAESEGLEVAVVFDGMPVEGIGDEAPGVSISFASGGRDAADHRIVEMVDRDPHPPSLVVVSSDKTLIDRVTRRGAGSLMSGRLLERLEEREL